MGRVWKGKEVLQKNEDAKANGIHVVQVNPDSGGSMKKIIIYSLLTILIFTWFISLSLAVEQPDGFVGMKWGESIERCKEKGLFLKMRKEQGNFITVVGKDSSIGKIGVRVDYFFYKNKFYRAFAKFLIEDDVNSLILNLKERCGEPKSTETSTDAKDQMISLEYEWEIRDVMIGLMYDAVKKEGILYYVYKPLFEEAKSEGKEKKGD